MAVGAASRLTSVLQFSTLSADPVPSAVTKGTTDIEDLFNTADINVLNQK
jgi:hypothetical protein